MHHFAALTIAPTACQFFRYTPMSRPLMTDETIVVGEPTRINVNSLHIRRTLIPNPPIQHPLHSPVPLFSLGKQYKETWLVRRAESCKLLS